MAQRDDVDVLQEDLVVAAAGAEAERAQAGGRLKRHTKFAIIFSKQFFLKKECFFTSSSTKAATSMKDPLLIFG